LDAAPLLEFRGVVRDGDDQAVVQEEVSIEGGGTYQTSDQGDFTFPSSPGVDIDSEVRFHVKNWIIVKPCESRNGRMFLPPPRRLIELEVYPRRDPRLITVVRGARLTKCIIEEMASRFPKSRSSANRTHGLDFVSNIQSAYLEPQPRYDGANSSALWTDTATYQFRESAPLDRYDFLSRLAQQLQLSPEEIDSAIQDWANSREDAYQKGLGALYLGDYIAAREDFLTSITTLRNLPRHPSSSDEPPTDYGAELLRELLPYARAEFELGNSDASADALRTILKSRPHDSIARTDLDIVVDAGKSKTLTPTAWLVILTAIVAAQFLLVWLLRWKLMHLFERLKCKIRRYLSRNNSSGPPNVAVS
jgi:hypothetical protein